MHTACPAHACAPAPQTLVIEPSILYFGTPVALISTLSEDGTTNLSPISSLWALGRRIVLGMGCSGLGAENLMRGGECVINLPSAALWRQVESIGRATGRDPVPEHKRAMGYVHEADKFSRAGLTPAASEEVAPLRVLECPLQIEARLLQAHRPAGWPHDPDATAFVMLETQALRVHAHCDIVVPGTHHIDTSAWEPLLYVFRHYFGTGGRLGANFRAEA
ncbi:MAG TPA: flavin reductase family protein [Paucimonas sp.]|nr:flavin reductase family protein [Paucimonas sp.]